MGPKWKYQLGAAVVYDFSLKIPVKHSSAQWIIAMGTDTWLQHSSGWLLACSTLLSLQNPPPPIWLLEIHALLRDSKLAFSIKKKWLLPGFLWRVIVHWEKKAFSELGLLSGALIFKQCYAKHQIYRDHSGIISSWDPHSVLWLQNLWGFDKRSGT